MSINNFHFVSISIGLNTHLRGVILIFTFEMNRNFYKKN